MGAEPAAGARTRRRASCVVDVDNVLHREQRFQVLERTILKEQFTQK